MGLTVKVNEKDFKANVRCVWNLKFFKTLVRLFHFYNNNDDYCYFINEVVWILLIFHLATRILPFVLGIFFQSENVNGMFKTEVFVGKSILCLERPDSMNIKCAKRSCTSRSLNDQWAKENVTTFNRRIDLNVTNRILCWKYFMKNADRLCSIFGNSIIDNNQRDQFHMKKRRVTIYYTSVYIFENAFLLRLLFLFCQAQKVYS